MNDSQTKKEKRLSEEMMECQSVLQDLAKLVTQAWQSLIRCQQELAGQTEQPRLF